MGDPEQRPTGPAASGPDGHGGLSASGWAAVTALGAAAITAAVTLVTHFVPSSVPPQQVVGEAVSPSPTAGAPVSAPVPSSSVTSPRSGLLTRLAGTWSGPARSGSQRYTMTLVVTSSCAEGLPCGTLTTDLLPCVGPISLVRINDGPEFDFATGSFSADSSPSCALRTNGGDYFLMGTDVLTYRTGYDAGLSGTLRRRG
ncbi:hypothetical protein [Terrabacter carboxydivorans]|uniref:Serine/threonine protein kinase n=1 Tax=Terrabacter carboxydivorans TaxID=619730 RepID=A0ABP5YVM9_9MICO